MKTKKYRTALLLAGISFLITSCREMDVFPQDQLGPGNFWLTENDIQMGVAGVYSTMKNGYMDWNVYWLEGISDNGYCQHPTQSALFNMQIGTLEATSGGPVSGVYSGSYKAVAACNNFMKNFPKAKANAKLTEAQANAYEAEIRFLRAYSYFNLVQRYGDIPLYKEAIESVEASKVKQSPAAEVYDFIAEDLDFAVEHLPDIAYGSGHAVKGSALGLKARIALFRGEWDGVIEATDRIISSGHYRLANTYESVFIKREGQLDNPEILFSITYLNPDYRHDAEREFYYWSALSPTDDLLAAYDSEKDRRAKAWYAFAGKGEKTWTNPMGQKAQLEQNTLTGWVLLKHLDKNNPATYHTSAYDFKTDNDAVLIRYADVYLMYIEAMVEKGGGSTADDRALEYMNAIRGRAGLEPLQTVDRDALRLERRRELAFEGLRHFDLVRWRTAYEVMNKLVTPGGKCRFEEKFYVWPFPQSEMDVNPQLDQKAHY